MYLKEKSIKFQKHDILEELNHFCQPLLQFLNAKNNFREDRLLKYKKGGITEVNDIA